MAPKRAVKAKAGASTSKSSTSSSPLSSAQSVPPPSSEVSAIPPENKPLKIKFSKHSAGFEPKPKPTPKASNGAKRKVAEMSKNPGGAADEVEEAPVRKAKHSKVAVATEASARKEPSGNTSTAAALAKVRPKRTIATTHNAMEASGEANAAAANSAGVSDVAAAAQANDSKESFGSTSAIDAKVKKGSAAMNAPKQNGKKDSRTANAAVTKSYEASTKVTAADNVKGKELPRAETSSSEVSSKSASSKSDRKDEKKSPTTPSPAKPTTEVKEPTNNKNGKGKAKGCKTRNNKDGPETPSPPNKDAPSLGRKRSRWEDMTVWDAINVPMDEEERPIKRARPNRSFKMCSGPNYQSVIDKLPSQKELADAAKTFPDYDVDLAAEIKNEMQEKRLKAEVKFLLSLPPVSELNMRV